MEHLLISFFDTFESVVHILSNRTHIYIGAVLTFVFWCTGGKDKMVSALVVAIVVDYISGIIKGFITGKLSSKTGGKGILKKVMMILVIVACHLADIMLGTQSAFKSMVVCVFLGNEILSIIENAVLSGIPIPNCIKKELEKRFEQLKPNSKENEKK